MFKIAVYLPYCKSYVGLRQFTNLEYKTLLKVLMNKDFRQCNNYIDSLIQSCVDVNLKSINFIDKLVILLNLRCISIGDTLTQTVKMDTSVAKLNYNIYTIIENISNFEIPRFEQSVLNLGKISIVFTIPSNIFIDVKDISNFIESITIKNRSYNLRSMNDTLRTKFVDELPGNIVPHLYEHLSKFTNALNKLELLHLRTDVNKKDTTPITLHIDQINMFTFVNVLFNEHLSNLFLKQFVLSKHHNIDCDYYDKMSPIESEIFFNFHKEIQEQEKKEASTNNNGPVIPGVVADSI